MQTSESRGVTAYIRIQTIRLKKRNGAVETFFDENLWPPHVKTEKALSQIIYQLRSRRRTREHLAERIFFSAAKVRFSPSSFSPSLLFHSTAWIRGRFRGLLLDAEIMERLLRERKRSPVRYIERVALATRVGLICYGKRFWLAWPFLFSCSAPEACCLSRSSCFLVLL